MQTLEVISVNIWQIIISLANLLILTWLLKKFLYAPVRKALADRRAVIDSQYADANKAKAEAQRYKDEYEEKLTFAKNDADKIRADAKSEADRRSEKIISDAKEKADMLITHAKEEAQLERQKTVDDVKREIADVSAALTEKLIGRELDKDGHRELIDEFIDEIGGSK